MPITLVGLFRDAMTAQRAAQDLAQAGFDQSLVSTASSANDVQRFGIPANHASLYSDAISRGGQMLTFQAPSEADARRAETIMDRDGAVDVEEIASGLQNAAPGETLQVIQERLLVGKREIERGGVRIRTYMTERPVSEQVTLREEHVNVERRPVDRPVDPSQINAFKEGTVELREHAEVPVVSKEARVVEEISIGKTSQQRTETVNDVVHETHVDIEQLTPAMSTEFSGMEDSYRSHFQQQFAGQNAQYETYAPAYRYGHSLAGQSQYQNADWTTVESSARTNWEAKNPGSWDRVRGAVQHAFQGAKTRTGSGGAKLI